ncbi:hypothetical protein PV08_06056 [Exophiala spinifera]|uniref:BTB domain-containing protein n=1 Tax=Exophiala spinifera TaxID=91928 RepID=A0A0D2BBQ5_9EURO|nr:uncharacterized protein PV08_06056 [Exophiala spinifera]KIW16005.1 hypothetical protein PV08_06056 [Exophiala spinifera]
MADPTEEVMTAPAEQVMAESTEQAMAEPAEQVMREPAQRAASPASVISDWQTDDQMEAQEMSSDEEPQSFTISPLVTVIVGKRRKLYKLHRAQLMDKSPFFAACLSSGMVEQQKNEVVLPEDSCRGFDIVADWVYNKSEWDTVTMEGSMLRAYVLADKYGMPSLQNALIDKLGHFWTYKTRIRPARVLWLARNAMPECPLYRLATEQLAYELKKEGKHYGDKQDTTPPTMVKTEPNAEPQPTRTVDADVDRAKELTKALAHPDLSTKLLWGAIHASRSTRPPAKASVFYRVPVNKPRKRVAVEDVDSPDAKKHAG